MEFLLTFLEGVASFVSPCVLPMLPVYAVYFAAGDAKRAQVGARAAAFVAGYTVVFVALGVFAGALGGALAAHRTAVRVVCGAMMCVFGFSALGLFHLPSFGGLSSPRIGGVFSAALFGAVYSLCILPCAGAFLGAALMQAAAEGGALKGAALLAVYSAGLGIPFFLTAIFLSGLKAALGALKRNLQTVNRVSGVALVAIGLAFAAGVFVPRAGENVENKKEGVKMEAVNVTAANFEAEVLKSELPVVVDFWAEWCGPCRMLGPVIDELAADKAGAVKICKVNVDEAPDIAARYGITSIPAVFLIRNGEVAAKSVGYKDKASLAAALGL